MQLSNTNGPIIAGSGLIMDGSSYTITNVAQPTMWANQIVYYPQSVKTEAAKKLYDELLAVENKLLALSISYTRFYDSNKTGTPEGAEIKKLMLKTAREYTAKKVEFVTVNGGDV